MADYYVDSNGVVTKKKKKLSDYVVDVNGNVTKREQEIDEELAPVKGEELAPVKEESEDRTWFKKSEGNWWQSILGSGTDATEHASAGVMGVGEKTVDFLAMLGNVMAQGELMQSAQNELVFNTLSGKKDEKVLERYQGIVEDVEKVTTEFVAKDLYDEEAIAKKIISDPMRKVGIDSEKHSVFGEKSDSLIQSGGQLAATAALQAVGVPWWLTTGATSFGGEAENALSNGATMEEAIISASITAGAEILTEKISGGIKFGGKTLDDGLTRELGRLIANKTARTLVKLGVDATGEGFEEVLSGAISAVGQKLTYDEEKDISLNELFLSEEAFESFIGGAVLGGGSNVVGVAKSKAEGKGRDLTTGLTAQEQSVVDKVYKDSVAEAEKDGKISEKEKRKIYDEVLENVEKGRISTDTIETVLGGATYKAFEEGVKGFDESDTYKAYQDAVAEEKAIRQEFEELQNMKAGEATMGQQARYNELKERIESFKTKSRSAELRGQLEPEIQRINALKKQLQQEVSEKVKGDRLSESYRELQRSQEKFQADVSKYENEHARKTIQNLIDGGIANNTNEFHEFADMLAKWSADKGLEFNAIDNKKLSGTRYEVKGATVNAFVTEDGKITFNVNSKKRLNSLAGHEITHVLEGTKFYNTLAKAVKEYATAKGEWDTRLASVTELYKKYNPKADPVKELTADLVGDYIFTDKAFLETLSVKHRNIFQFLWDEIKYMAKTATAGSKEARALMKAEKAFADAYRASGEVQANVGAGYSLTEYTDHQKQNWSDSKRIVVYESQEQLASYVQDSISGKIQHKKMYFGAISSDLASRIEADTGLNVENYNLSLGSDEILKVLKDHGTEKTEAPRGQRAVTEDDFSHIVDVVLNPTKITLSDATYNGKPAIIFTGEYNGRMNVTAVVSDKRLDLFVQTMYVNVKKENLSTPIGEQAPINTPEANSGTVSSADSISQNSEKSSGETKKSLSPEQEEFFKDSVVRDEDGNLKVMYHGTSKGGHTVFDPYGASRYGLFGLGSYFTDNKEIAESYTKKGNGDNPQVYEVYLNITNPMDMDTPADPSAWAKVFPDADFPASGTNEDFYRAMEEYFEDMEYVRWEAHEAAMDAITSMGHDGITHIGGGRVNADGPRHRVYIAFTPEQIKNTDNLKPTNVPDMNYSLSSKGESSVRGEGYAVYGENIRVRDPGSFDFAPLPPMQENAAPVREDVPTVTKPVQTAGEGEYAPISAEDADALREESMYSLTDADAPPEKDAPYYGEDEAEVPADPFENRDIDAVGNRKIKAYMYENPEVKPFFQAEANLMLGELARTTKGERIYVEGDFGGYGSESNYKWMGTKRKTSDDIAYLLDELHYSYAEIEKGLKAIIEDDGKENNAVSKRIEFLLNDRLLNGYRDMDFGYEFPPNQDYVKLLNEKQITEYNDEARARFFENADAYVPPVEDIAPVRDDVKPAREKYEAIRPRKAADNADAAPVYGDRMVRVDSNNGRPGEKQRKWVGTSTGSDAVDGKILPDDLNQDTIHYQPISNKATLGEANARLSRMGYESSVSYFNSQFANKKISLEDIALGERLIQEAVKRGDTKTAGELIQNVALLGTELGQKVQALSIIKRLTPEGQLGLLKKTIERGKTKGDKTFEGVELTQDMIDKILAAYGKDGTYDQAKLNRAVEDVKKDIADQMKVTKLEKVNAWRYLSMLGNPKTHIRNVVSNVAMRGTVAVKNAVARTIESVAPIGNRTKTWAPTTAEVKAFAQKTALEMKETLTDDSKYNEAASIKEKRTIFKNKVLNAVYEFNSDMLSKEDWWFSRPAFVNSLSEFLTANGIRTEADIQAKLELVEKAKLYATEQSQIATFRQYSWLAHKISEMEHANTAANIAIGSILPFKRTPINIAKAGLNYSPLGFMKTLTYDASQVKNGKMEASEMVDHLAQNVTGTALTLVGYLLASAGFLSGGGEDDKEGKYDYQLGEQAYSVNIGGTSYSLSWLSPVAMPLFVGANAYEQLVEGKEWNGDVVVETLAQTLDPLNEMSFLSGLTSVLSSYDSGMQKFAGIGETMIQNYATQFIPTAVSQVATVIDDTKRTSKVSGDSDNKFVDGTINKLKYKIPGLRETLEPTTDIWGNEIKQTENVLARAFEAFIAPYSKRENIATDIDAEIKEIYSQTGDGGVIPSIPSNYVNYGGEKYEMSGEEYTTFKSVYGQVSYDLLRELMNSGVYKEAGADERADMVNKVYDYARDEAKRALLESRGVEYTNASADGEAYYREDSIKGAIENNMTPDEYSYARENPEKYNFLKENNVSYAEYQSFDDEAKDAWTWAYNNPDSFTLSKAVSGDVVQYRRYAKALSDIPADKDANGKTISDSRKEKVIEYINNLDADYGQKIILFKSEYNADDTYNRDIIDYLDSRADITYEEMVAILTKLGFKVSGNNVTW